MSATPAAWLLDTNVVSAMRRKGRLAPPVRRWLEAADLSVCFLADVTIAEIRVGIEFAPSEEFAAGLAAWLADDVLTVFGRRILRTDEAVLLAWLRLMRRERKLGLMPPEPDALIAACAAVHGFGLVTRNVSDFARAGLMVANPWDA